MALTLAALFWLPQVARSECPWLKVCIPVEYGVFESVSPSLPPEPTLIPGDEPGTSEGVPSDSVPAILKKIAFCESGGRQYNENGEVIRGKVNPQDIGKYQINATYHQKAAESLGLDIYTEAGNEAYALHLYETQGTSPWNWSKPCWGGV